MYTGVSISPPALRRATKTTLFFSTTLLHNRGFLVLINSQQRYPLCKIWCDICMEPKITKEGLFQFTQHFTQFVSFKKKSLILETCIFSKQYSSTIIRALKEYTTCEKTKTLALTIQTSRPKFKFFVTNRPIFICPWISRLRGHNKCITQNVTIFIMQYSRREILWGITFKLLCLCLTWKMREFLKKQINLGPEMEIVLCFFDLNVIMQIHLIRPHFRLSLLNSYLHWSLSQ